MKQTVSKRIFSTLLALAMVIGLIPTATLTAFAAGKTEVTQIETRISAEYVPYAGREYTDLYTYVDTSIYGSAQASGSDWVDDAGVTIEVKGNGDYGEWYDIRYQFEAGRTYTAEYTYMINPAYEETYKFAENTAVTLTNPDPSKCTITGEIIEVRDSGRICDVRYTMTIAGERSYPDIKAVTLQKIAIPADGVTAETTALMYSNCTLTSQAWSPDVDTFAAGNTYTLTVNLHAKDGYKFSNDFAPVLGIAGYEKAADHVELLNSNKDAAVSFTYAVGDYTYIDTLQFVTNRPLSYFIPTREKSGQPMNFPFDPADGTPFENRNLALGFSDTTYWYNETDGYEMNYTKTFEAGKVYSLSTVFDIKKDLLGEYRFADNATAVITGPGFYQSGYRVECGDGGTSILVKFLFTAQFPEGAGSSAGNPAFCYSYEEFKFAMEDNYIRYVALGNVEDSMPLVSMEDASPYGDNRCPGIWVNSNKNLILLGDAQFTAPNATENVHRVYDHLIQVRQGGNLTISGTGSLTFHGNAVGWVTSVATVVDDSVLTINGGTVKGDTGNRTSFCYGVNVNGGILYVNDGTVIGTDRHVYGGGIAAVMLYDGVAYIRGGNFSSDVSDGAADHDHYGLSISEGGTAYLYGGNFEGINMPYAATMNDYVESGYTMTVNGVKTDPASCGTTDQCVEVYQEISEVDININAPTARKDIPIYIENVYGVPEGCTVKRVTWLEDGGDANSSQFVAGKNYTVEIALTADNGVRFANPLESATINFADATVTAQGIGAENGIILSYDFGICPAIISDIALTVDPPKQNGTPDQTVACGDYAYKHATGNENMWDDVDVYWEESADGKTWKKMATNATFTVGRYYRASINVLARRGNLFAIDAQVEPNVLAIVNGYYATVTRYPEEDPGKLICVTYNFGMLNDNIIEQIDIDGVAEPVVGDHPGYNCAISGSGYTVNTAYDNGTYAINGMCWYDVTYDMWMKPAMTFQIGHEYKVFVDVKTQDGYEFYTTVLGGSYPPAGWGYINDNYATLGIQSDARFEQSLSWTFICKPQTVKSVSVMDLEVPAEGFSPDYDAFTDSDYYTVESIEWMDYTTGAELSANDTFVDGHEYWVMITVVPTEEEGNRLCQFVQDKTVAYLNGIEVKNIPDDEWQEVQSTTRRVRIFYTFKPTVFEPLYFVTGQVTSTGDEAEEIVVQLIPDGFPEPAYETIVQGNVADYFLGDIPGGIYTLRVSKAGHLTAEYLLTVTDGVIQNVTLIPDAPAVEPGDVNGDGKVNNRDLGLLQKFLNGSAVTIDTDAADLYDDGKINNRDLGLLQKKLNA